MPHNHDSHKHIKLSVLFNLYRSPVLNISFSLRQNNLFTELFSWILRWSTLVLTNMWKGFSLEGENLKTKHKQCQLSRF